MHPNRADVVLALRRAILAERDALRSMTEAARSEATHEQSRPENQYDTRALEASYLAAGQGERLGALTRLAAWFDVTDLGRPRDRVEPGALVQLEEDTGTRWVFVAPEGGARVRVDGIEIQAISPASPLGKALVGLEEHDSVEVDGPNGTRELVVAALA